MFYTQVIYKSCQLVEYTKWLLVIYCFYSQVIAYVSNPTIQYTTDVYNINVLFILIWTRICFCSIYLSMQIIIVDNGVSLVDTETILLFTQHKNWHFFFLVGPTLLHLCDLYYKLWMTLDSSVFVYMHVYSINARVCIYVCVYLCILILFAKYTASCL